MLIALLSLLRWIVTFNAPALLTTWHTVASGRGPAQARWCWQALWPTSSPSRSPRTKIERNSFPSGHVWTAALCPLGPLGLDARAEELAASPPPFLPPFGFQSGSWLTSEVFTSSPKFSSRASVATSPSPGSAPRKQRPWGCRARNHAPFSRGRRREAGLSLAQASKGQISRGHCPHRAAAGLDGLRGTLLRAS